MEADEKHTANQEHTSRAKFLRENKVVMWLNAEINGKLVKITKLELKSIASIHSIHICSFIRVE